MNALLSQYNISKPYIKMCNVSRGLSETVNCAHELFRGHSHCVMLLYHESPLDCLYVSK